MVRFPLEFPVFPFFNLFSSLVTNHSVEIYQKMHLVQVSKPALVCKVKRKRQFYWPLTNICIQNNLRNPWSVRP